MDNSTMQSSVQRETRKLGKTNLSVTPVGLGVWQFSGGQNLAGSYWPTLSEEVMNGIVERSLQAGITWFDTAEVYGNGQSEKSLARALKKAGVHDEEVVIATKWWPAFRLARTMRNSIGDRLYNLGGYSIDLFQVHQPWSLSSVEAEMEVMAELLQEGKIKAIGVSNFGSNDMGRAYHALQKRNIPLASNQVKYSLLDRRIEFDGTLATAKAADITIIAYSPLEQGVLTGKFHRNPELLAKLSFPRKVMSVYRRGIARTQRLIDTLENIAAKYNATAGQVALNWLISYNGPTVVVIPGATSITQAEQNAGAMDFSLSSRELTELHRLTKDYWY